MWLLSPVHLQVNQANQAEFLRRWLADIQCLVILSYGSLQTACKLLPPIISSACLPSTFTFHYAAFLDPSTKFLLTTQTPLSPSRLLVSSSLASSSSFNYHLRSSTGSHLSTCLFPVYPVHSLCEGPPCQPTLPSISFLNQLLVYNCVLNVCQESKKNYDRSILNYSYIFHCEILATTP